MPNDTTTLNGALRQLGETMAANLTTQGVPSTYDEGLTTLAGKILDIQGGGGTRTLTLTADKSILSYYDGDEAILSATLLEDGVAVSGATVEFFNGSTSMGTAQTDSNGVATKTYTSTGAGDVSLKAEADNGTLVSETYTLEDCLRVFPNTYTSQISVNLSLPTNWQIQFILNSSSYNVSSGSRENVGYVRFDSATGGYVGKGGSGSRNITCSPISKTLNQIPIDTDVEYTLTKVNNVLTLTDGTDTVSGSTTSCTNLNHFKASSDGIMKNIRIKPL